MNPPPQPKRSTQAGQARQRKKLATPFRSPLVTTALAKGGLHAVYASGKALRAPAPASGSGVSSSPAESETTKLAVGGFGKNDYTVNAAKQFKSPLAPSAVSDVPVPSGTNSGFESGAKAAGVSFSSVRAVPTIQALQGRLQTLKQAIKITGARAGEDDDSLEDLAIKWTLAGREVAWALWEHVKDLNPGNGAAAQSGGWPGDDAEGKGGSKSKRPWDSSWGYGDEERGVKRIKVDGDVGDGAKVDDEGEGTEDENVVRHSVGTMLRHLAIDPATLGWDEEEGDFVDVDET